ncbi:MAG: hypothetical protein WC473_02420 [Patescibacteria group bacterium]
MPKETCRVCHDNADNINGDFCPECGQPSTVYKKFIEGEMELNGELDPY